MLKNKRHLTYCLLIIGLLLGGQVSAQVEDPKDIETAILPNDSTTNVVVNDTTDLAINSDTIGEKTTFFYRTFRQDYPNPKKAILLSVVPGVGQVYNKKYWKLPVVYGAMGGLVYSISFNNSNYQQLQTAFLAKANDMPHEFTGTRLDDLNTLRTLRDSYDKNRQLSYIGLFVVYLLQGVDAFVDAHLLSFDVDEDLSLQVKPSLENTPLSTQPSIGLGLRLQFGR